MNRIKNRLKCTLILSAVFTTFQAILLPGCKSTKQEEILTAAQQKPQVQIPLSEEYQRSTKDVQDVSYDEFLRDKKIILNKIDELSDVMSEVNYTAWLKYVDENSKKYWSSPINLKKASQRLPVKGIKLKDLEDYFKFVFIPARKNHRVEEIRYVAKDNLKAVQVKDEMDVVYYNFQKEGDEWMVVMPPLEN